MDPFDMAWQLLRKAASIEGPVDPRRPGMSPGMSGTTGRMQDMEEDFPPEAYEQLNQALEEEARLRNMPTDQSELPPPPSPKDTMRQMPPRTGDLRGFPPHMIEAIERAVANSPEMREKYEAQRSAGGGRPPQGTSVQNPDDVLRSMSPIDLAMDALQKRTPRSYRGEGGEQFAEHAMTAGADTPEDIPQEEYQEYLDNMAAMNMDADAPEYNYEYDSGYFTGGGELESMVGHKEANRRLKERGLPYNLPTREAIDDPGRPSDIPVDDPARHHQLDVGRQEALAEGVDMQQTRTPPADAIRRTRNDAEIPKNPFQEAYPYSSRLRPGEPPQGQGPREPSL